MRRVGWLLVLAVLLLGVAASADCGCSQGVEPDCYVTFETNEHISFSAVFPLDYFTLHAVTETPFVLGWTILAADGSVVRSVAFPDVVGWGTTFFWDLDDAAGQPVEPGFYQILVATTAGTLTADVRLVSCCTPCTSCWSCCVCSACPTAGGRCPTPCGEPYIALDVYETTHCCGLTFQFWIDIDNP